MAAKTQQRRTQVKLTMRKKHRSGQLRRRHHLQLIVKAELPHPYYASVFCIALHFGSTYVCSRNQSTVPAA